MTVHLFFVWYRTEQHVPIGVFRHLTASTALLAEWPNASATAECLAELRTTERRTDDWLWTTCRPIREWVNEADTVHLTIDLNFFQSIIHLQRSYACSKAMKLSLSVMIPVLWTHHWVINLARIWLNLITRIYRRPDWPVWQIAIAM